MIPTISSGVAGPLGAIHLPRLWSKVLLSAHGQLEEGYDECGHGFRPDGSGRAQGRPRRRDRLHQGQQRHLPAVRAVGPRPARRQHSRQRDRGLQRRHRRVRSRRRHAGARSCPRPASATTARSRTPSISTTSTTGRSCTARCSRRLIQVGRLHRSPVSSVWRGIFSYPSHPPPRMSGLPGWSPAAAAQGPENPPGPVQSNISKPGGRSLYKNSIRTADWPRISSISARWGAWVATLSTGSRQCGRVGDPAGVRSAGNPTARRRALRRSARGAGSSRCRAFPCSGGRTPGPCRIRGATPPPPPGRTAPGSGAGARPAAPATRRRARRSPGPRGRRSRRGSRCGRLISSRASQKGWSPLPPPALEAASIPSRSCKAAAIMLTLSPVSLPCGSRVASKSPTSFSW